MATNYLFYAWDALNIAVPMHMHKKSMNLICPIVEGKVIDR